MGSEEFRANSYADSILTIERLRKGTSSRDKMQSNRITKKSIHKSTNSALAENSKKKPVLQSLTRIFLFDSNETAMLGNESIMVNNTSNSGHSGALLDDGWNR